MGSLIAVIFEGSNVAADVRKAVKDLQRNGLLTLEDAAVLTMDTDGKVSVDNELDRAVKWGAIGGAVLGPLLMFTFPLAGLAMGAAGGALVGKSLDRDIDKTFVDEVRASLHPGSSALLLMVDEANNAAAVAALEPYSGTVYSTTLSTEDEETLRRALR